MVRAEDFAVHLVSQHHALVGVHHPVQLDGCAVVTVGLEQEVLAQGLFGQNDLGPDGHTSLSAPSMHTNLAFLLGRALRTKSAMATPVNSEVETPAAPHEKPLLFRTWFCSFLRLPAHTKVIGQVICSYSAMSWRRLRAMGLSTSLPRFG